VVKRCPHCKTGVNLYVGKYRCAKCHLWLEQEECLEAETVLLLIEPTGLTATQKKQGKLISLYVDSKSSEINNDNQTHSHCKW
jgi:hypothetical protein